jgi:hypothetical protein
MSDDPGDRPVLNPDEFDITDDERVAEIGDDRYVVSASGDPPDTGGRDHGGERRRDDHDEQPRGRDEHRREGRSTDTDGGTATRDPQLPEGSGGAPHGGEPSAHGGGPPERGGEPPTHGGEPSGRGGREAPRGTETPSEEPRGGGAARGGSRDVPETGRGADTGGQRDAPRGGQSPREGRRSDGTAGGRQGHAGGQPSGGSEPSRRGETPADLGLGERRDGRAGARDPPARERASGSENVRRGAPRDGLDSAAVRRHLARSLSEPDFRYGFDATLTADGETSRHRMVSDDLPTTFETLVTWFAQSVGGDTSPERALGLLLTKSDASVELPPDLIRKAAVEHGLSADDSIGDLLRAAKEEGSITME